MAKASTGGAAMQHVEHNIPIAPGKMKEEAVLFTSAASRLPASRCIALLEIQSTNAHAAHDSPSVGITVAIVEQPAGHPTCPPMLDNSDYATPAKNFKQ